MTLYHDRPRRWNEDLRTSAICSAVPFAQQYWGDKLMSMADDRVMETRTR
jgi:hypothetical protein